MNEVSPLVIMAELHLAAIPDFDARSSFERPGQVRIKAIGGEFRDRFLKGAMSRVRARYTSLRVQELAEPLSQARVYEIIRTRGGDLGLVDLWRALEMQPQGQEGCLNVEGKPNGFFMLDTDGSLCAVNAVCNHGWSIDTWRSPDTVWPKGSRFPSH